MINDDELKRISDKYGTPLFIFDADELLNRVNRIKSILYKNDKKINLCFSIKANPFLIPVLLNDVDYFEVCSPGELKICKTYNVPGEKIIYSGVNKGLDDITEAIEYNVKILTAESIRHYDLINESALSNKKIVDVILRISSKSQFGMSIDDIKHIISKNIDNNNLNITGIHYFAGTQRSKLKHQRAELEMLRAEIDKLRNEYNIPLNWLEYGPGLPYPYFEGDDFTDTLYPLEDLSDDLYEVNTWSNLTVEMGRFIASSCGYYLTGIADVKTSYDNNWCILDGGINHVNYFGQMMGLKVPIIKPLNADSKKNAKSYTLCGSLCTTNDILVREYSMQEPSIGDVLAFCNIGAYSVTEGMNLFLSRNMPKVVVYNNGEDKLVRDTVKTWELNS